MPDMNDGWQVMGQVGGQQAAPLTPSLLQMAQGDMPTNNTPEGIEAAQQYVRQLQYIQQLREASNNPQFEPTNQLQNTIAGFGARYVGANDISYEPSAGSWGDSPGFYMDGPQPRTPSRGLSGFYMGSLADKVAGRAKPIDIPEVQGDAGRQLGRLPQHLRDAFGPAVVQHIMHAGGGNYPGSIAYAPRPQPFDSADSFRLNRDAWGQGFGLGSSDVMHPQRPWPA